MYIQVICSYYDTLHATHCNTMSHTATHCVYTSYLFLPLRSLLHLQSLVVFPSRDPFREENLFSVSVYVSFSFCRSNLHYTVTHCLQHTATHCNTLQHTATHCNTLQHTATHYDTLHATHCNTMSHTATHCNTLACNTLHARH